MTKHEFKALLDLGHETNGVEFKAAGMRANPYLAGVVRAMLGMANRRDGGLVILGVEPKALKPVGFDDPTALQAWLNYDELAASVNGYASPCFVFEVEKVSYLERDLAVIRVQEFAEVPIICCKDCHDQSKPKDPPVLRKGAYYVRSRHKPETSEIPSEEEMRELLELAIDKGVRRFVSRAQKAGLIPPLAGAASRPTDEALFEKMIEEMQ